MCVWRAHPPALTPHPSKMLQTFFKLLPSSILTIRCGSRSHEHGCEDDDDREQVEAVRNSAVVGGRGSPAVSKALFLLVRMKSHGFVELLLVLGGGASGGDWPMGGHECILLFVVLSISLCSGRLDQSSRA